MTIQAALPDGTILEFEEGTPDDVIDRVVQQQMQGGAAPAQVPAGVPAEEPTAMPGEDQYYDVPRGPDTAGFESALAEYYRSLPEGMAPDEAKLGEMATKYNVGTLSNVPEILDFYQQYGTLNPQVNIKGPESVPPPPPAIEDIIGTLEPTDINVNRARAVAKGAFLDFGDEMEAMARVLGVDPSTALRGPGAFVSALGQSAAQKFMAGELTADEYYRTKNQINAQYNAYAKANPGEALGLEVAGGVAGTFVPGLGVVSKGVQLGRGAGALARGAAAGASTGALSGLGQAKSMALSDIGPSVIEQAAIGTVFGGGLGKGFDMLGRRLAPRAGTGTPDERRAAEMIFEATQGGVSPQRAVGTTRASGAFDVPTPFGMATPELAALSERVLAKQKPTSRDLAQTLVETQSGASDRLAQQAREAFPTSRDFFDAQGEITQRLRQIGEQDYQRAFAVGTVRDPQIESLIKNPELASIWKEAQSVARLGGRELNVKLEAVFDEGGALVGVKPTQDAIPDVEALDYFKRALDDQIDAGFRGKTSGGKNRAAALRDSIRKPLLERLDDLVPEYKEARSKYAGDLEVREALDYGRDMLSKKFRPQEVQQRLADMSIAEREAVKTGALQSLLEPLEDATRRGNVAQQIIGVGDVGTSKLAKLKTVMDPAEYDFFETALRLERDLYNRASKATGGSRTVPLAEGVAQLDALIGANRLEDAVNFVMAGPQGRAASLARWASRFAPGREFGDKVYGQLSKALKAKNPQELADVLGMLARSESYTRFVTGVGDVASQRVAPVAGSVAPSLVEDRGINPPPAIAIGEEGDSVEDAIAAAQAVIDAPLASEEAALEADNSEPEVGIIMIDGREAIYDPTANAHIFTDTNEFVDAAPMQRGGMVRGYQEGGLVHNRGPRPNDEQINRTVIKLIQQDRSAEEIVAYLNSIEPGLGDRTNSIKESVDYFREQRGLPIADVKTTVNPSQITPVDDIPIDALMRGMSGFDEFALPAARNVAPIFGGGADVLDFLASKVGQYGGYREGLQNRMQNLEDRYAYLGGPSAASIAGNRAPIDTIPNLSLEGIESVPGAVSRVAPQVFQGAVDYVTDQGISGMLRDAKDMAVGAYEDFTQDPYGSISGGMFNATLLPPLVNAFASSRAAARQYGEGVDRFRGQNAPEYVEEYQGMQDEADALSALSVLGALPIPFAGKIGRSAAPRRRKARGGLAVKRKQ